MVHIIVKTETDIQISMYHSAFNPESRDRGFLWQVSWLVQVSEAFPSLPSCCRNETVAGEFCRNSFN